MSEAIEMQWTIWWFRGPTSGEVTVAAKASEPGEIEHEYQKVLARVTAYTAEEAIEVWHERGRHE